jgi:hypothetical protein
LKFWLAHGLLWQMTTIGYGDISAGTLGERAFAIVVMMIG